MNERLRKRWACFWCGFRERVQRLLRPQNCFVFFTSFTISTAFYVPRGLAPLPPRGCTPAVTSDHWPRDTSLTSAVVFGGASGQCQTLYAASSRAAWDAAARAALVRLLVVARPHPGRRRHQRRARPAAGQTAYRAGTARQPDDAEKGNGHR